MTMYSSRLDIAVACECARKHLFGSREEFRRVANQARYDALEKHHGLSELAAPFVAFCPRYLDSLFEQLVTGTTCERESVFGTEDRVLQPILLFEQIHASELGFAVKVRRPIVD